MTSRERVLTSLAHREPDRVAVDFGGHRSSGIAAIAYARLKRMLGISSGAIYVYDMVQQLAIVEEPVLDALGVDTIELGRGFMKSAADWKKWELPDGTPCVIPAYLNVERRGGDWYLVSDDGLDLAVQKRGSLYFEQTHFPLSERPIENESFADLEEVLPATMWTGVPCPGAHLPLTPDGLSALASGARALRESTSRAIIGLFGGSMFEVPQFLYRNDQYLVDAALHPEACVRLSERLCDIHMGNLEKWISAVGPYVDVVLFSDDFGGQNGPLVSPQMYRTYYKPFHSRLWHRAKELAPVKVMLHSCGAIEPLLEDLIDAGVDMVNPVQTNCAGMNPLELKRRYGSRITLWGGGCDTRSVLPRGTPAEVRKHVRAQLSVLAPGGGFVFQQVHNALADVPPENLLAMFKAAGCADPSL